MHAYDPQRHHTQFFSLLLQEYDTLLLASAHAAAGRVFWPAGDVDPSYVQQHSSSIVPRHVYRRRLYQDKRHEEARFYMTIYCCRR